MGGAVTQLAGNDRSKNGRPLQWHKDPTLELAFIRNHMQVVAGPITLYDEGICHSASEYAGHFL